MISVHHVTYSQFVKLLFLTFFFQSLNALRRRKDRHEVDFAGLMGDDNDEGFNGIDIDNLHSDLGNDIDTALFIQEYYDFDMNNEINHHTCGTEYDKETLVFITPWNNKGYDYVKVIANRINWLSPVWLQLRIENDHDVIITGTHDIDQGWIDEVKGLNENLSLVPRIKFEVDQTTMDCSTKDYGDCATAATHMISLAQDHNFEGYTIEVSLNDWQLGAIVGVQLRNVGLKVLLVLPPLQTEGEQEQFQGFFNVMDRSVDRYIVMTYDAGNMEGSRPNAPLPWVASVIKGLADIHPTQTKAKILLGIPCYGWRGANDALTGHALIEWQEQGGLATAQWMDDSYEHFFEDQSGRFCSFPTPKFVCERLALSVELNVAGSAFWELGQVHPSVLACL